MWPYVHACMTSDASVTLHHSLARRCLHHTLPASMVSMRNADFSINLSYCYTLLPTVNHPQQSSKLSESKLQTKGNNHAGALKPATASRVTAGNAGC